MTEQTKFKAEDRHQFQMQIDELKKLLLDQYGDDFRHLEDIPNFTGMDEPIPFPYGDKKGEGFGQWLVRPKETEGMDNYQNNKKLSRSSV